MGLIPQVSPGEEGNATSSILYLGNPWTGQPGVTVWSHKEEVRLLTEQLNKQTLTCTATFCPRLPLPLWVNP